MPERNVPGKGLCHWPEGAASMAKVPQWGRGSRPRKHGSVQTLRLRTFESFRLFSRDAVEAQVYLRGSMVQRILVRSEQSRPELSVRQPKVILYSRRDAAFALSLSLRSLDYLISNGEILTRRIGGRVLVSADELAQFSQRNHPKAIVPPKSA